MDEAIELPKPPQVLPATTPMIKRDVLKHKVCCSIYGFISEFVHNLNHLAFTKISAWISVLPCGFIPHRGVFQYSVGWIWVAPVVIGILGGRVSGALQWIG